MTEFTVPAIKASTAIPRPLSAKRISPSFVSVELISADSVDPLSITRMPQSKEPLPEIVPEFVTSISALPSLLTKPNIPPPVPSEDVKDPVLFTERL